MMTGPFVTVPSTCPRSRASRSIDVPGACGAMMVMALSGKAFALPTTASRPAASAREIQVSMGVCDVL